jgi:hypothetical protein
MGEYNRQISSEASFRKSLQTKAYKQKAHNLMTMRFSKRILR